MLKTFAVDVESVQKGLEKLKVGDLVQNGQGHTGIVTGIGYAGNCPSYDKCPFLNPDIHVITPLGKRLWSYKVLELISEGR
jgi:hypothetical protein